MQIDTIAHRRTQTTTETAKQGKTTTPKTHETIRETSHINRQTTTSKGTANHPDLNENKHRRHNNNPWTRTDQRYGRDNRTSANT